MSVLVPLDQVDRIFERIFLAANLDIPGNGYIFVTPLLQAATYIPPHLLND
jgi:nitrogen regulatory protein PII